MTKPKAQRRFRRRVNALQAQKIGLLRELTSLQARYELLAKRHHPATADARK